MNLTAAIMITAGLFPLLYALRKARPGTVFLSAFSGLASLFAADIILSCTGADLPVNAFTAACAAVGGMPGVILVLVLNAVMAGT